MNIDDFLKLNLLTEANVYNIKLPINNVSVDKYLQHHLADITDPTIKQQLTKKLSLLLVNYEPNLTVLNRVPPNAPDWAQQAASTGELFAFVPDEDLNDAISNIAHYVQAAFTDINNADNNIAIRAKQEIAAIPKMPNLDTLYQKANQYFNKKVKKEAAENTEGMEEVIQYAGWIWYKLLTTEAYVREGNIIQNCIGKHWTKDKCDRERMTIYVLRSNKNDSVVAIRIYGDNDIKEIKGKNNKPPIPKYMTYVFSIVKDTNLVISDPAAKRDLRNAGYWVFNDKIIVPMEKATEMFFDDETQKLRQIQPDKTITVLNEEFKVFNNPSAVSHMCEMMDPYRTYTNIKIVYKGMMDNFLLIFLVNGKDELRVANDVLNIATPEIKSRLGKYIVAIGAQEKLKLDSNIQYHFNLSSEPPYTPLAEMATCSGQIQGFDKIDISKMKGYDNWMALKIFFKGCIGPKSEPYINQNDYQEKTKKGIDFNRATTMYRSYTSSNQLGFALFVDNNNSVINIVSPSRVSSSQLNPVRKLIEAEHLTLEKSASFSKEIVIVPPSTIVTKKEFIANKMAGKKTANTKTVVEFEDGASFKLLEGQPLTDWLDQATANTTTDAVYVLMVNNDPKIALPITKKRITGMFAKDTRQNTWRDDNLRARGQVQQPTTKTLDFTYGKYVNAFAKKMGFTVDSKNLLLRPESKINLFLQAVDDNPGIVRSRALKAARVGAQSAPGIDAPYNMIDRPLKQLGLITYSPGPRRGTVSVNATEKGKEVARRVRRGESVPMFSLITQESQVRGGNDPDPIPVPTPRPQATPGEPRAARVPGAAVAPHYNHGARVGSKAQQIYDLFCQLTDDNNGTMPGRGEFIRLIQQPPFNMTPAGAGTYHYNMKTKYLQQHGQLGETFTFKEWLIAIT